MFYYWSNLANLFFYLKLQNFKKRYNALFFNYDLGFWYTHSSFKLTHNGAILLLIIISWPFLVFFDEKLGVVGTINSELFDWRLSYWIGYFIPGCIILHFFLNFCYFVLWPELILLPASAINRSVLSKKKDYVKDRIPCEAYGMHFLEARNNFFTFAPTTNILFRRNYIVNRIRYLENDPKLFYYLPDYFFIYFFKNAFKRSRKMLIFEMYQLKHIENWVHAYSSNVTMKKKTDEKHGRSPFFFITENLLNYQESCLNSLPIIRLLQERLNTELAFKDFEVLLKRTSPDDLYFEILSKLEDLKKDFVNINSFSFKKKKNFLKEIFKLRRYYIVKYFKSISLILTKNLKKNSRVFSLQKLFFFYVNLILADLI